VTILCFLPFAHLPFETEKNTISSVFLHKITRYGMFVFSPICAQFTKLLKHSHLDRVWKVAWQACPDQYFLAHRFTQINTDNSPLQPCSLSALSLFSSLWFSVVKLFFPQQTHHGKFFNIFYQRAHRGPQRVSSGKTCHVTSKKHQYSGMKDGLNYILEALPCSR
jgi:hypothetical protein